MKPSRTSSPPLHLAAAKGEVEAVKALLAAGVHVDLRNDHSDTPLHRAKGAVVDILLEAGAYESARDKNGGTPLHYGGTARKAQALIAAGADVNARDKNECTPLHYGGDPEKLRALIDAGADVHARDSNGGTPLHYASTPETAQVLIDAGADVDVHAFDNNGWTPLHNACLFGKGQLVHVLLAAGANANARDPHGRTPLHVASSLGCVQALVATGVEIDAQDVRGRTALHESICRTYDILFELLVAGARHDIPDENGSTPADEMRASLFIRGKYIESIFHEAREVASARLTQHIASAFVENADEDEDED